MDRNVSKETRNFGNDSSTSIVLMVGCTSIQKNPKLEVTNCKYRAARRWCSKTS